VPHDLHRPIQAATNFPIWTAAPVRTLDIKAARRAVRWLGKQRLGEIAEMNGRVRRLHQLVHQGMSPAALTMLVFSRIHPVADAGGWELGGLFSLSAR
jgi:hypothetical protein